MARQTISSDTLEAVDQLPLREKSAFAGSVLAPGPLVSDRYVLFNQHFVRKSASEVAQRLADRENGEAAISQERARTRFESARDGAIYEGELLGHIEPSPAVRTVADQLAGIQFEDDNSYTRHVWIDAHRLRLLMELFHQPLRFYCRAWNEPVVLKRGTRSVGCIMPASPCPLDIAVET